MSDITELRGVLERDLEAAIDAVMDSYNLRFSTSGTDIAAQIVDMALELDRESEIS